MDNDYISFKYLLGLLLTPFLYLIGKFYTKVEHNGTAILKTNETVSKHGIRIDYLEESVDEIESKLDQVLSSMDDKLDAIMQKLK